MMRKRKKKRRKKQADKCVVEAIENDIALNIFSCGGSVSLII